MKSEVINEAIAEIIEGKLTSRNLDLAIAYAAEYDYGKTWPSFKEHQAKHGWHVAWHAHSIWLSSRTPRFTTLIEDAVLLATPPYRYSVIISANPLRQKIYTQVEYCELYKGIETVAACSNMPTDAAYTQAACLCVAILRFRLTQLNNGIKHD